MPTAPKMARSRAKRKASAKHTATSARARGIEIDAEAPGYSPGRPNRPLLADDVLETIAEELTKAIEGTSSAVGRLFRLARTRRQLAELEGDTTELWAEQLEATRLLFRDLIVTHYHDVVAAAPANACTQRHREMLSIIIAAIHYVSTDMLRERLIFGRLVDVAKGAMAPTPACRYAAEVANLVELLTDELQLMNRDDDEERRGVAQRVVDQFCASTALPLFDGLTSAAALSFVEQQLLHARSPSGLATDLIQGALKRGVRFASSHSAKSPRDSILRNVDNIRREHRVQSYL